jgi:hypothetical protein
MLVLLIGSTPLTAYVSKLTTLRYLELKGRHLSAAAAMMHLQPLTRLTHLDLNNRIDDAVGDGYFSFSFYKRLVLDPVWVSKPVCLSFTLFQRGIESLA